MELHLYCKISGTKVIIIVKCCVAKILLFFILANFFLFFLVFFGLLGFFGYFCPVKVCRCILFMFKKWVDAHVIARHEAIAIILKINKMETIQIKLYDLLRKDLKLNEPKAQEFVQVLDSFISEEIKQDKNEIATKDFVKKEIIEAKNDMIKWFVGLFITLELMIIGLYLKK